MARLKKAHQDALDKMAQGRIGEGTADQALAGQRFSQEQQRLADAANFTPGPGLNLQGSASDQAVFLEMIRREMARSPSFHALMLSINGGSKPLDMILWGQGTAQVFDGFLGHGVQGIDMADFAKVPVDPPPGFPEATTQGEWLAHAMAEARAGTNLHMPVSRAYPLAHADGISAGNAFRQDRGQGASRTSTDYKNGNQLTVEYARNGTVVYTETFTHDPATGTITNIARR